MTIRLSEEIEAALAVLDKHGYAYGPPEMFKRAFATEHALGFKAGIEAAAAEAAKTFDAHCEQTDWSSDYETAEAIADAITSLPTPPSPLPEILEAMRPVAREAQGYENAAGDKKAFPLLISDLRAIAAMFTKLGGKIE